MGSSGNRNWRTTMLGKGPERDAAGQVAWESARRSRLAVPAIAGGVLYLLSGVVISSTLNGAPTVGLLQGIAPALKGVAHPPESARAPEVRFVSHHALTLIAGSALMAIALLVLTAVLLLLANGARFRRPESMSAMVPLVIVGGLGFAFISLAHQIATAVLSNEFTAGHDFTNRAVEHVLTTGTVNVVSQYISLLAGLALAAGMIVTSLNSMRVGLLPRWMGIVGILSALLIFLPIGGATLELIPAFWLAACGMLLMGRWPSGDPPAWAAGAARPWPSQAEMRARQEADRGGSGRSGRSGGSRNGGTATLPAGEDAPPAAEASNRSRKRRKRSARR